MRIVFDFQACQSASRYRGIGRGSRSLMQAMARLFLERGNEVICMLNGTFIEGLDEVEEDILAEIPKAKVIFFQIPTPCAAAWPQNYWRQMAARLLREHAIACLEPDFVHIPALLSDGWGDDAVASVGLLGVNIPVSLTQHDLIPLVMSSTYMTSSHFQEYYKTKLENVKQADLLLAISEYSYREVIERLEFNSDRVVNISSAADSLLWKPVSDVRLLAETMRKFGIRDGFFLYAPGGFDYRKNIDRLFEAYAMLTVEFRAQRQLVIASKLELGTREILEESMQRNGLNPNEVLLTDYVSDENLKHLYSACYAYVFPSLHEGFGLPALEAMSCGSAVIASNCTGIPEVVGLEEALFDPYDSSSIAAKLFQVHSDADYRARLQAHAKNRSKKFSWDKSAEIAVEAMITRYQQLVAEGWKTKPRTELPDCSSLINQMRVIAPSSEPTELDIECFRKCYDLNFVST